MSNTVLKGLFDCPFCEKIFEAEFEDYSKDMILKCTFCNKIFSPKDSLTIVINKKIQKVEKKIKEIEAKTDGNDKSHLESLGRLQELLKSFRT